MDVNQIQALLTATAAELLAAATPGEPVLASWEKEEERRVTETGLSMAQLLRLLPPDARVVDPDYVEQLVQRVPESPEAAQELAQIAQNIVKTYPLGPASPPPQVSPTATPTSGTSPIGQRFAVVMAGALALAVAYWLVSKAKRYVV